MGQRQPKPEELKLVHQVLKQCISGIEVRAFGSRTNNTAKPHSDLDLAVMTEQPLTLQQGALLTEAFEGITGVVHTPGAFGKGEGFYSSPKKQLKEVGAAAQYHKLNKQIEKSYRTT